MRRYWSRGGGAGGSGECEGRKCDGEGGQRGEGLGGLGQEEKVDDKEVEEEGE